MTESKTEKIRILLADDHTLVRQGLRKILELDERMEVIDEVGDGQGAVNIARKNSPQVVLMDLHMPGMNGIEASKVIKAEMPHIGVIILTAHNDEEEILKVIDVPVDGYLLKDVNPNTLYSTIYCVAQGESVLSPLVITKALAQARLRPSGKKSLIKEAEEVQPAQEEAPRPTSREENFSKTPPAPDLMTQRFRESHPSDELTERERDVLNLIAQGASNATIAGTLYISEKTVKNHITNIFRKLQVTDRTQAALYAIKSGLVRI
ncbi:response regulator [Heliorestis convoluta]|uniref:Stage 0 sporulation protein A homolog n=1 Tax=Heliorestis convoluta TaxID=356322 RepID=A0A5Q2N4H7_9FIRM|nr:response regulator transcription factor [Heliorestis convoluta]QGG47475.1 transcriptional regulator luxR family protein [Heliorestis convoluta]